MPTPEQIRQAAINTRQQPRNHAPAIFQAIQNDEGPTMTSRGAFYNNVLGGQTQREVNRYDCRPL